MLAASRFTPLESPEAYDELVQSLDEGSTTVVKFVAPSCRTCRASNARLSFVASKWPRTRFYEVFLAAGTPFVEWAKARGLTTVPYIEVYLGAEQIEALVVPPSRVRALSSALTAARQRLRQQRRQQGVLRLRSHRRERSELRSERSRLVRLDSAGSAREPRVQRGERLLRLRAIYTQLSNLEDEERQIQRRLRWDRVLRQRASRY